MKSVVALFLLALAPACGSGEAAAVPRRPGRVVLVVLDSVRSDHVGAYGYGRPTTPRLDALAERGVLFERAYAGSSAAPQSLATLWTGRLPSSGGATGLREAAPHADALTLPRLFLRAGFRTALASNKGGLRERAFTRGFDDVEVDSDPGRWSGELVTAKALELVDQAAGEPLLLVVGYADASEPHFPPAAHRARIDVPRSDEVVSLPDLRGAAEALPAGIAASPGFADLVARYDAELAHVDECIGGLVDGLEVRGLLRDTLLVVTSSHGVELLEHGYVGSAWTLYEEVVRVPLVVHAPDFLVPGRVAGPVSLADVVPTLEEVCALEAGRELDGRPLLEGSPTGFTPVASRGAVIAELVVPELTILRACIGERWKLIEAVKPAAPGERLGLAGEYDRIIARMQDGEIARPDPWGAPVRRELYDLAEDSGETSNAVTSAPEALAGLRDALEAYARFCADHGFAARPAARRAEIPDGVGQLQQLGYL